MPVVIERHALRTLNRLDPATQARIKDAIAKLPSGDVRRLKGRNDWALRVGGWRVLYEVDGANIRITAIRSRGDVYKG
jgi:mRNA interferase RelE/StbE